MATAATIVVCQTDVIVDEIDPEIIVTPHIFIDYMIRGEKS